MLTEEGVLELGVGALEGCIVPVEAAACLCGRDEQAEQHGPEQRLVLRDTSARVRTGEDGGGRLAAELLQGDRRVLAAAEPGCVSFGERVDKRPILVQCGAAGMLVLDERDRELAALVQLAQQERERAERESVQGVMQLR